MDQKEHSSGTLRCKLDHEIVTEMTRSPTCSCKEALRWSPRVPYRMGQPFRAFIHKLERSVNRWHEPGKRKTVVITFVEEEEQPE